MPDKIVVTYRSIDRYYKRREFRTLEGARAFAVKMVGPSPEISRAFGYAVSDDGIGKVEASISLDVLFDRHDFDEDGNAEDRG